MTDAELIKAAREILKLTQEQFALKMNVTRQAVMCWETGRRNPKPDAFRAMLDAIVSRTVSASSRHVFINEAAKQLSEKAEAKDASSVSI